MGTETQMQILCEDGTILEEVKLNNPLMGTET